MEEVISNGWQWRLQHIDIETKPASVVKKIAARAGKFSMRLAQEGEWVRIVSVNGGKKIHERLAGVGLWVGADVQVLQSCVRGKLLLGHGDTRFYLGGGMAHKIHVAAIEGDMG